MKKIWQKKEVQLLEAVEKFTVGDDYLVDMNLVPYDIMGSIAHSRMLASIGVMSSDEQNTLEKGLKEIYAEHLNGEFNIPPEDEDVHTRVEKLLTDRYGEPAKKLHTARSRNDQVLTDVRLYNKDALLKTAHIIIDTIELLSDFAEKHHALPMCGYTHMQRAMPSSVGQWAGAFAEELTDLLLVWKGVFELNDACPLGSGAGFGVSLDIDRKMTAQTLGFDRVQVNSIYCQNSRGKIESQIVDFLASVGLTCNKIATDLMTFTTAEFDFFKISESITTGSSIMPQKKNLDVMELVRGRTAHLVGFSSAMKSLASNLISGYHRDLQDTKKIIIEAFDLSQAFLLMVQTVFQNIEPKKEKLLVAFDKTVFATDFAYNKVKEGVPFREAYREVGSNLDSLPDFDPEENILSKKHLGSTGNLGLNILKTRLHEVSSVVESYSKNFENVKKQLLGA